MPDERGAVTAEAALALPVLVMMTVGLVWLLSLGTAQLQVIDAARETARAVARGDAATAAVEAGRRVAPDGGTVVVSTDGDHVVVEASARIDGPGRLFSWLPGVTVRAEAFSLAEAGQ